MNIHDAVRSDLNTFRDVLPEPDERRKWLRFDCPWCDGKDSAAVNYDAGWFECFRCSKTVSVGDRSAVTRYSAQIEQAARNLIGKYGHWITYTEAQAEAQSFVLGYDRGKFGDANDAGMLTEWEFECRGDPNQLDRYVLQALNCDLLDYAKKKVTRIRRESPIGEAIERETEHLVSTGPEASYKRVADSDPEARFDTEEFPFSMHVANGMSQEQIAKAERVSLRTVQRRLADEKELLAKYL